MTGQPPAHELRVRKKLLTCGAQSLSDTELLAVFISSGSGKKSCVQALSLNRSQLSCFNFNIVMINIMID